MEKSGKLKLLIFFMLVCIMPIFTISPWFVLAERAEESLSTDEKRILSEARKDVVLKNFRKAEIEYKKILERFPDLLEIRIELAKVYTEQKDWEKAAAEYREIIFLKPDDPKLQLEYAKILLWGKQLKDAQGELLLLYKNYPEREDIIEELVNVYLEKKQWNEAIKFLQKLCIKNPNNVEIHMQLGLVLSWSKKYKEALVEFNKALELSPDNFEAKKEIAYIHSWLNQWPEAEEEFKELIKEHPQDQKIKEELANIYFYQERFKEAGTVYEQIISFNPDTARQLSIRLSEIKISLAPVLSYNFFYYHEKQKHTDISAENHQHLLEYTWPLNDKTQPMFLMGYRHDRIVGGSLIFGCGLQYRIFPKLWIEPGLMFEPNHGLNPRNTISLSATFIPNELFDIRVFDIYRRLWDKNRANTCGSQITGYFLKDKSLRLRYGLYYDWIHEPSDYFVRIDKSPDQRLNRWNNIFTVEKDLKLRKNFVITPGYSFGYDSTSLKQHTFFGNITLSNKYFDLIISGSYGWDSDDYIYKTAGCYISHRF